MGGSSGQGMAIRAYLEDLQSLIARIDDTDIQRVIDVLLRAYADGATIFALGNGGSSSTASHFACDLGKNVQGPNGRRFRVLALTDNVPMLTAWANDTSYEHVFAEQLDNLVRPADVVVAISGSGNSPNVLRAMGLARARGATTIGLTGFRGGRLAPLCDVCVVVPSDHMDQIEDVHLALQHLVCRVIRQAFLADMWPESPRDSGHGAHSDGAPTDEGDAVGRSEGMSAALSASPYEVLAGRVEP